MSTDTMVRMWMYASQELRGGTGIPHGDELAPEIDGEFKVDREWVWVDLDAAGRGTSGARAVRREGASLKMSPPCFSFLKMKMLLGTILFLVKLRWGSSLVYIFYPIRLVRVRIIWQRVQHDHVIFSLFVLNTSVAEEMSIEVVPAVVENIKNMYLQLSKCAGRRQKILIHRRFTHSTR